MCGRFTLKTSAEQLARVFALLRVPEWTPRYNIAPSQNIVVIRQTSAGREPALMQWGLIPSWANDARFGAKMMNARSETAHEKPTFREAFKSRRCLIPADGFFEWQKVTSKIKQPFFIGVNSNDPVAFAGLWETWESQPEPGSTESQVIESCTILTTDANSAIADVHNRMPVILNEADYDRWLNPDEKNQQTLLDLLKPYPAEEMDFHPISTLVNNVKNDVSECLEPQKQSGRLF